MLPGGSGTSRSIVAHLGRPCTLPFPAASRVSISELLGSHRCRRSRRAQFCRACSWSEQLRARPDSRCPSHL